MPKPLGNSSRYIPGLDGLRAIAVLAVIAYHVSLNFAPGGLLGVTVFFTLSGYLITDILLTQWAHKRKIDFKDFWLRRARRLLPAMFIMLALVCAWLALTDMQRLSSLTGDIGSALLYVSNWWLIFHDVSYFESFGPPSPLGHFWSLAVEEQFYLLWPILLVAALGTARTRGQLASWTLAAAAISACLMTLLYTPGEDPSRVYYGTDTRAFALLIGATLAIVWPRRKLSETVSPRARIAMNALGTAGLLVIVAMMAFVKEYDDFLYQGGMVVAALATATVVAAVVHPAVKLSGVLGWKPLRWLGVRSYGIYLYHYPIIVLTTPLAEFSEFHALRASIQFLATLAVAELSWRYIEEPIRKGALGRIFGELRRSSRLFTLNIRKMAMLVPIALLVTVSVSYASHAELLDDAGLSVDAGIGGYHEPVRQPMPTPAPDNEDESGGAVLAGSKPGGAVKPEPTSKPTKKPVPSATPKPTEQPPAAEPPATENPAVADDIPPPLETVKESITIIGDSVIINAAPHLEKQFPNLVTDGKVGRQMTHAGEVIDALKQTGKLGNIVVLELGTNGSFSPKVINGIIDSIGKECQIILINTRVPRDWQEDVNKTLAEADQAYDNVSLIDWYAASKGKDEYFLKDGVHLAKEGAIQYAKLIADAIIGLSRP